MVPRRASAVTLARLALAACVAVVVVAGAARPAMAQARNEPIVPDWVRRARELKPSVVYIIAKGVEGGSAGAPRKLSALERFFGLRKQSTASPGGDAIATSLGTGFILTSDGYIGTNNHVLENFTNIHLKLDNGAVHKATVVGRDPKIDLALLKVELTGLPPIILADSSTVQVGEPVHVWAILSVVALGTFITALDASIVNIGLPSIARTFRTPVGGAAEWVIIAYLVAIAATLLSFGHLSDLVGRKPVWLAGLATFTVGSMLCGAAPSLALLVLARAFQGLGGAMIFAPGLAIITDAFPPAGRGRALGVNAVVFAVGTSLGPTLGGLITEHLSWRWIFYLNVPFGALALLASQAVFPRSGPHRRERFDVAGAGLLAVGFALLTVVLSFSPEWGWASARLLTCLAVGTVALLGAVLVERRASRPIVDLALFRQRMLASSLGSMTLAVLALFAG